MRAIRRRLADLFGTDPHGPVWVRALGGGCYKAGCRLCGCGDVFAQLACAAVAGWALGKLAVELGLVAATAAASATLGARVQRWRQRRAAAAAVEILDLYEGDRARGHADCIAKPGDGDLAAAWAAGYQAHKQRDEARLVMAEVERREREPGTWS